MADRSDFRLKHGDENHDTGHDAERGCEAFDRRGVYADYDRRALLRKRALSVTRRRHALHCGSLLVIWKRPQVSTGLHP